MDSRLTRDQNARKAMLTEAVLSAPAQDLASWLMDALALSEASDEALTELSNQIGRIPHDRLRATA